MGEYDKNQNQTDETGQQGDKPAFGQLDNEKGEGQQFEKGQAQDQQFEKGQQAELARDAGGFDKTQAAGQQGAQDLGQKGQDDSGNRQQEQGEADQDDTQFKGGQDDMGGTDR